MLFARRRSSLSNDKFSCLNSAFLTCCLFVVVGHVTSMSLDRLGSTRQARQFQQINDKQLEYSEFMLPEAESGFLQNDMELVPAEDGTSDMYLLVPTDYETDTTANDNQHSIEEQNSQSLEATEQEQQVKKVPLTSANDENNSDMLMLESNDIPAVQILEPTVGTENQADEQDQQSENMMDTLAEAVQEIKNELETELVEQPSEEQKVQDVPQEETQEVNELHMEHKYNIDTSVENLSEMENLATSLESLNSEQEMIGVVREEPEKSVESVNEAMDLQADESEIQPAVMEMNNESHQQMLDESENKIEEIPVMSQEISEENIETVSDEDNQNSPTSQAVENVKPIKEMEHQDDQVNKEIKDDSETSLVIEKETISEVQNDEIKSESANESQTNMKIEMPAVEQIQADNAQANQNEIEETLTNKLHADDETQEVLKVSAIISSENQASEEKQQKTKVETMVHDETQMPEAADLTQSEDEVQQLADNVKPYSDLKPNEEMKPAADLIAESPIVDETPASQEEVEVKPIDEHMQQKINENVQHKEEVAETNAVEQAEEVQKDVNEQNDDETKETTVVEENQVAEETVLNNQADQTTKENVRIEAQAEEKVQTIEETEPVKEIKQMEDAQTENEAEILSENVEESQPLEEAQILQDDVEKLQPGKPEIQSIEVVQPMEEAQPIEEEAQILQDDVEEDQTIKPEVESLDKDAQLVEKVQPTKEAQPVEQVQSKEEIQSIVEDQPVKEAQPMDEIQPMEAVLSMDESQPVEEAQHMDEIKSEEEEIQTVEEVKPLVEAEKIREKENKFEEIKPNENAEKELQTPEKIQANEDSQGANVEQTIMEDMKPIETVADTQSLSEDALPMDNESEQQESEIIADESVAEENALPVTVGNEEKPAKIPADESVAEEISLPVTVENEEKPAEISVDEPVNDEISAESDDNHNEEVQPIILADEDTLQNIETAVDEQKDKQAETSEAEVQKPLDDKDSDNILNDDTNESETTSMLTTIVQVPTKEEQTQQQQQQEQPQEAETVVETTIKPLNVLNSVLDYVNASFMNQMNNENNDDIKQDEAKEEEQAFSSKLRRYDGAQVWRIVVQNDRERKLADELQTKYDGQLWKEVKQEVDYLLKPNVLADAEHHVKAANLSRIVLIDNLQKVIEVENPPPEQIAEYQNRKGHRLTWKAYHRLDDIYDFYETMAKTYPDICSVEIIGYSLEKKPLKILKISNGNANNPSVWMDGGMHAREWISPAVVTYVANQIVEGWDDLPAYMRNINWYIHAVANPDGYEYSHTTDRLWRKNTRSHGRSCPGVDLNRNFGYKWGGKGTSANPCAQTYRGSKAFSEPETFYIAKFISSYPRDTFKAYLSFHSYGQYILYPWGYDYHITTDMTDLDLLARQAGTIITKSTGAKYTVGSSAQTLYPAAGGSDDWAKGIAGIKYAYTIEMGDTGRFGFVLPAEYIEPNGKNGYIFVETIGKAITMGKNGRRRKLKAHNKTH